MTRALQASSSVRRSKIREHYRSAPVDPYAAVRAEMTARLQRSVLQNMIVFAALEIELGEASMLMLETDPDYLAELAK